VALDGEADELVDQLGVGEAARLPQLGVHRDRGEPRDRVHLVEEEPAAALLEEEVDPCHPVAAQRLEHVDGHRPHLVGLLGRERRRHEELRPVVDVLVLVVVELVPGHDLAGHRGAGRQVAEHGDLDLAAGDGLLHHHPLVVGEGDGDRGGDLFDGLRLGDADGGPHVRRLHEDRKTERVDYLLRRRGRQGAVAERQPAGLRHAVLGEHLLGHRLVHRQRRPEHPTADVGDVGQFEHPLHRAVLAHRSVEQGQHDRRAAGCGGVRQHRRGARRRPAHLEPARQCVGPGRQGLHRPLRQLPLAVAPDADGGDRVALRVGGGEHVGGGHTGDVVLRRLASEQDDEVDARLGHASHRTGRPPARPG
jgi:hypothetical protein